MDRVKLTVVNVLITLELNSIIFSYHQILLLNLNQI